MSEIVIVFLVGAAVGTMGAAIVVLASLCSSARMTRRLRDARHRARVLRTAFTAAPAGESAWMRRNVTLL